MGDLNMQEFIEIWKKYLLTEETMQKSGVSSMLSKTNKELSIKFPSLKLSEQWGKPGTEDRKIIEMFTSKIGGTSLKDKINSLNQFVSGCDEKCVQQKDVSEILASLVFLDALSSVIYDFNPMTGGFLFESIVTALLGGDARQIETGAAGSEQDVTDIILPDGNPASLKLFYEGGSQYIKGSENNLYKDIMKYKQPIKYIIGIKNRNSKEKEVLSFDFYEFTVGLDPADELNELNIVGDFTIYDIGSGNGLPVQNIIGGKSRGRPSKDELEKGLQRQRQYKTSYFVARLDFGASRSEIQQIATKYTQKLGNLLINIYSLVGALSDNINKYYVNNDKTAGVEANKNAGDLKNNTKKLL